MASTMGCRSSSIISRVWGRPRKPSTIQRSERSSSALRDGDIWIKLTVYRTSGEGAPFDDVRSLHDAMVSANADRLVWGSDWPFLNQKDEAPDTGKLLDVFGAWVGDADLRRKILVENPARLYDFQELDFQELQDFQERLSE